MTGRLFSLFRMTCALMVFAFLTGTAMAAPTEAFDAANRSFGSGKYPEAISQYEAIIKSDGYSASVLFNLGNAYYRNGQLGLAIVNYERALRLSPRDPDIQANLKSARTQANLMQPVERWWRVLLKSLTPSQWAWLASALFTLFCLLTVIKMLRAEWIQKLGVTPRLATPIWQLILVLSGFAFFLVAACGAMSVQERHEAIIVVKEAMLLGSPFDKSETIATLPEGESVTAEKKYGNYIFVRYGKGKSAWVNQSQLVTVEPDLLNDAP